MKLTLGKYRGADASLRNVFARPVALKAGPHLALVWRHATRDVTKNIAVAEAAAAQAETLEFFPVWSYAHPPAIELAAKLATHPGKAVEAVPAADSFRNERLLRPAI